MTPQEKLKEIKNREWPDRICDSEPQDVDDIQWLIARVGQLEKIIDAVIATCEYRLEDLAIEIKKDFEKMP